MMKSMNGLGLGMFALLFFVVSAIVEARTFTNREGKKIEGAILSVSGDKVELEIAKSKKVFMVPVAKLSDEDQEFIKEWSDQKSEAKKEDAGKKKVPGAQRGWRVRTSELKKEYKLEDNFDGEWPKLISYSNSPEIVVVEEDEKKRSYIYQSPNYEYVCDVRLSKTIVKKFATLFEATRLFMAELPISSIKARLPEGAVKYKILLFESKQAYIQNGGPPDSAGVFMPSKQIIMVPLTSLGVKKVGSGYMYDYKGSNKTLPHEIAHQLTDPEYFQPGSMGWFSEGLAEYVGVSPYRSGKFSVRSNQSAIEAYVTAFGKDNRGRNLGESFSAPDLKYFMLMSYSQFTENANFNYGLGLLMTYHFFHFEEGGRTNINAFLKALKEGKKGEEALESLLAGRTFDELEEDIAKSWRSRGVKINFK